MEKVKQLLSKLKNSSTMKIFLKYGIPALITLILAIEYTYIRPIQIEGYIDASANVSGDIRTKVRGSVSTY